MSSVIHWTVDQFFVYLQYPFVISIVVLLVCMKFSVQYFNVFNYFNFRYTGVARFGEKKIKPLMLPIFILNYSKLFTIFVFLAITIRKYNRILLDVGHQFFIIVFKLIHLKVFFLFRVYLIFIPNNDSFFIVMLLH